MHRSKTIPRVALASLALLVLMLGLTIALKWTVKAQEPPAIASADVCVHKDIGRGMRRASDARLEGPAEEQEFFARRVTMCPDRVGDETEGAKV